MSKFIDSVVGGLTGRHRAAPLKRLHVSISKEPDDVELNIQEEFRVEVRYFFRIFLDSRDMEPAKKNFVADLRNVIYGEYIDQVLKLERAVIEGDEDVIRAQIHDILREVRGEIP